MAPPDVADRQHSASLGAGRPPASARGVSSQGADRHVLRDSEQTLEGGGAAGTSIAEPAPFRVSVFVRHAAAQELRKPCGTPGEYGIAPEDF